MAFPRLCDFESPSVGLGREDGSPWRSSVSKRYTDLNVGSVAKGNGMSSGKPQGRSKSDNRANQAGDRLWLSPIRRY